MATAVVERRWFQDCAALRIPANSKSLCICPQQVRKRGNLGAGEFGREVHAIGQKVPKALSNAGGEGACRTEHGVLDYADNQKTHARHLYNLAGRPGNKRPNDQYIQTAAYLVILTVPCTTLTLNPTGTSFVSSLVVSVHSQ